MAGGASVGTDAIRYVSAIYATQYNDVYDAHNFNFRLANPTFTTPYNAFRGNGGSDTIIGNGYTTIDYLDSSTGVVIDLVNGFVTHGASTNIPLGSAVALGAAGTDTISGVRDISTASNFADTIYGGNNSALNIEYEGARLGGGNDVFFGGSGFDEAKYDDFTPVFTSGINVVMAAGHDANGDFAQVAGDPFFGVDKLYQVEAVRGSMLDDTYNAVGFHGGNALNSDFAGALPSADFNRFNGYSGNDTIVGNGYTQLEYRGAEGGVTVTFTGLGSGTVTGDASVGTDTFSGVYSIRDWPTPTPSTAATPMAPR